MSVKPYNEFIEQLPKEATVPKEFTDPDSPGMIYRVIDNADETEVEPKARTAKKPRYTKAKRTSRINLKQRYGD